MAVSKRLRYEIFRRDNHTCRYCGASAPDANITTDHVIPTALGGTDTPDNLVTACVDCNSGKTSTTPDAPLVADVADDAVRWAGAMAIAAQEVMEDSKTRTKARKAFLKAWTNRGGPEPPEGWRGSIDSLLAGGLPPELIAECVDIAADRDNVAPRNRFKYMCGIGWRKIEKLRERAEAIAASQRAPGEDDEEYRAVDLATDLLSEIHEADRKHLLESQRRAWEGEDIAEDDLVIYAAQAAFSHATTNNDTLADYLDRVLKARGDYEHLKAAASRYFADIRTDDLTFLSYIAYLASTPRSPHAA